MGPSLAGVYCLMAIWHQIGGDIILEIPIYLVCQKITFFSIGHDIGRLLNFVEEFMNTLGISITQVRLKYFRIHLPLFSDKHVSDLNPEQLTESCNLDSDYVVSSRIRTARNIRGFCLSPHISRAERREVERIVRGGMTCNC